MISCIHYTIALHDPAAHIYRVTCFLNDVSAPFQDFRLPSWIPGSYMIRDFSRHLSTPVARDANGKSLFVTPLDSHGWRVSGTKGSLSFSYEVFAHDLSVRGAWLDRQRGFFNASSLCVEAVGSSHLPQLLSLQSPQQNDVEGHWQVATTLPAVETGADGFGHYQAENYDALLDHPFTLGRFDTVRFTAENVGYEVIVSGRHRGDLERLACDLRTICSWQIRFFGTPAPFSRYQFQLQLGENLYGGLEHRDSTALMASRHDLPVAGDPAISDGYLSLLGLCSHEHFHAWNIKRIKPAAFTPYRLNQPNHTRLLWAFEGITSYYDDLTLVRSGLITPERYLGLLAKSMTRVRRSSGRLKQTLSDSSFDAWTKFYKQDENSPNAIVSYYQKGALAALALDLTIRQRSSGRQSLDDVMRQLWHDWQQTGEGVAETGWESTASRTTGLDLAGFFDQAIRSTQDLPLDELLAQAGVRTDWRAAMSSTDEGGLPPPPSASGPRPRLGARTRSEQGWLVVTHVLDHSLARLAGMAAGDLLLALDGLRLRDPDKAFSRYQAGDAVTFTVMRDDELLTLHATIPAADTDTCWLDMSGQQQLWCAPE
ncbi:M61 family metallopeptidase [Laribacter hongkongensis]|uniref:M61 family metallopeptidase n=1 Tax=Laribacter hongkongensis TaxID=168471 RepID=UPI001EFE34FE|nr:PDZ domain-containing protein [Laribacter hongkongensis]MCG9095718.1 PDZ domain-containing protein [Laribacter hongkongensis]